MQIWENEAMDNEVGSSWELETWLTRTNPGSQFFHLYWGWKFPSWVHLSCVGQKITYFIRASGNGEINKENSSIIGDKEIKIERQGSIISSTTRVEGGWWCVKSKNESQKTYDGAMQNMDFGTERRQICRWKQMSKSSKMEPRELSTKFYWTLSNCTINSAKRQFWKTQHQ